jgi:predicted RNase H-like HicB family nuclease
MSQDLVYPVTLTREKEGGFTVTFADLPFGITAGNSREEVLANAVATIAPAGRSACRPRT